MVQRYIGSGETIDHVVASTDAVKGEFRVSGSLVVQLLDSGVVGATVPAAKQGRFSCVAETGVAWTAGDKLYLTAGSQTMTKTSAGNTFAGYAAVAKLSATATGEIVLSVPGS